MVVRNYMEESSRVSVPIWGTFVVSILLHVLLIQTRLFDSSTDDKNTIPAPIEIAEFTPEMMTPPVPQTPEKKQEAPKPKTKTREMRMAETDKADNNKIDPNAKFLGERNQTVEEQLKAKQIDDFRSGDGTGAKGSVNEKQAFIPPTAEEGKQAQEEPAVPDTEGMGITENKPKETAGVKRNWKTLSLKDLSVGGDGKTASASDDNLDGVNNGNRTILSTREFRYFSYYHRIKELLRQHWKPSVEQKLYKMWARGNSVTKDELVTSLLVLLDTNGKIQKISRTTSSGFEELDSAAIESFHKAGPFPNPPKGIIEDDGFVRIKWDFVLKTEASPRIQFQSAGAAPRGADR